MTVGSGNPPVKTSQQIHRLVPMLTTPPRIGTHRSHPRRGSASRRRGPPIPPSRTPSGVSVDGWASPS
ncbi:hypothetical protein L083_4350 [Actinoplanes sp. N902-109]|nr:hypothetical protein L083_4350 [Actinoplanes sp. N902-109]